MKKYTKVINGVSVIKFPSEIIVINGNKQTLNPSHELLIADGWRVVPVPVVTMAQVLSSAIADTIKKILDYDGSANINKFIMRGVPMWLDKATRAGLMLRLQAEQATGKDTTTLWYNNEQYTISIAQAFVMLYTLEVYASKCYDNTQRHIAEVSKLQSVEDVEAYDYTTGYPDILTF